VRSLGGFQQGGRTTLSSLAQSEERRELLGKGASGFSSYGPWHHF
jgi:hypothetical protein